MGGGRGSKIPAIAGNACYCWDHCKNYAWILDITSRKGFELGANFGFGGNHYSEDCLYELIGMDRPQQHDEGDEVLPLASFGTNLNEPNIDILTGTITFGKGSVFGGISIGSPAGFSITTKRKINVIKFLPHDLKKPCPICWDITQIGLDPDPHGFNERLNCGKWWDPPNHCKKCLKCHELWETPHPFSPLPPPPLPKPPISGRPLPPNMIPH